MVMSVGQDVGSYRLVAEISRGRYAMVYQAVHRILSSRVVALKLLYTAQLHGEDDQEDFFREARILAELQHPHILPLVDADIYEGIPYIMTEFATHGSLRSRLNRQPAVPLPVGEALSVLKQVGEALHFAHQHNVVHCDVKPENILFRANDEAVMADFDIARVLSRANTAVRSPGGTAAYMAPEQFHGKVRKESDQYALGCIAYELLTGRRPFSGEDQDALVHAHLYEQPLAPTQVNGKLPGGMDGVILRALAKKYAERYEDIPGFLEALSAAAEVKGSHVAHVRVPLVLKDAAARRGKDVDIYYEETELNAAEGEVTAVGKGRAATAASRRRTTKAAAGEKAVASRKGRTAAKSGGAGKAASKKETEAEAGEAKKPVRRTASSARGRKVAGETVESGEVAAEKKVAGRKRAETVARKSAGGEKVEIGHDGAAAAGEVGVRKVRVVKKADSTHVKSEVVKKRVGSGGKRGVAGDERVVRRTRKSSSALKAGLDG